MSRSINSGVNQIGHWIVTLVGAPLLTYLMLFISTAWLDKLTRQSFWDGVLYGYGLLFLAPIGAAYYLRRGYRIYYVCVFLVPAVIGFVLATASILAAWRAGLHVLG